MIHRYHAAIITNWRYPFDRCQLEPFTAWTISFVTVSSFIFRALIPIAIIKASLIHGTQFAGFGSTDLRRLSKG